MAYYNEQEDEDQQDPNAQGAAQQGPTGSQIITGGSTGGNAAPQAAGSPDKAGNFVGLKDYLGANRVQAQKLGDQVAGNINQSVDQAGQAISGLGGQFSEKIKGGQISNFDSALDEGKGLIDNAGKDGNPVNDQQKQRYGEIASAQYKGPNSLTEATDIYQPVVEKVGKANERANLTQTEEGKQTILREMSNSPTYTTGAQRFDSYLLNDPNFRSKADLARTNAAGLQGQLGEQDLASQQAATQAKSQAQSVQDSLKSYFGKFDDPSTPENEAGGALGGYQGDILKQLQEAKQYGSELTGRVNSGGLTLADLQKLGLQNDSTYGVDLKNFYQEGIPTEAGVTDASEKARYDALLSLGGLQGGMYAGAGEGDFGNYSPTANVDAYRQAVGDQKNVYENVNTQSKYQDLLGAINRVPWDEMTNVPIMNDRRNAARRFEQAAASGNADQISQALQAYRAESDKFANQAYGGKFDPGQSAEMAALETYLNQTLPETRNQYLSYEGKERNLPRTPSGDIDWGSVDQPTGGVGKGPAEDLTGQMPDKKKKG